MMDESSQLSTQIDDSNWLTTPYNKWLKLDDENSSWSTAEMEWLREAFKNKKKCGFHPENDLPTQKNWIK